MEARMAELHPSASTEKFRPSISIRSYRAEDRDRVFRLLSFLPDLYPRSFDWLERRLADVERKHAHCTLAFLDCHIAGILIDTPKGVRTSKISTFFVREQANRNGVGTRLFQAGARRWCAQGVDDVYVTVASLKRHRIDVFLRSNGFIESENLPDRYGPGRDELIYSLTLN
jgi:GNAT superfamily N-acetyltransferase